MRGCEFCLRNAGSLVAILVIQITGGCARPSSQGWQPQMTATPSVSPSADELRERAHRTFARAIFYKPREESLQGIEGTFAPLIVEEIGTDDECMKDDPLGSIDHTPYDAKRVDPRWTRSHPTVYFATHEVALHGNTFQQVVYLWWYSARHRCPGGKHGLGRGVRVVVDPSGFPILWEALEAVYDERYERRVFFVSGDLEARTRRRFGEPLPDRSFAIEGLNRPGQEVLVAGLIDDASTPMGPYVYLDNGERNITSISCRCMPSQFENVAETREYNLLPIEALGGKWETSTLVPHYCLPIEAPRWGSGFLQDLLAAESVQRLNELLRLPD